MLNTFNFHRSKTQLIALSLTTLAFGVHCTIFGAFGKFFVALPAYCVVIALAAIFSSNSDTKGKFIVYVPALLAIIGFSVQSVIAYFGKMRFSPISVIAAILLAIGISALYKYYRILLNYSIFVWMLHFLTLAPYLLTLYDSYKDNGKLVTNNWVTIAGITFQPSEIAKVLYVFSLATILNNSRYSEAKKVTMCITISATCALLLIMQGEFGSIFIMFAVFLIIMLTYISQTFYLLRVLFVLISICIILGSAVYLYTRIANNQLSSFLGGQFSKVLTRVNIWQHFADDVEDTGYQLYHGLRAMRTGGMWGTDRMHFVKVPVSESDMVFPMIVQLYGMVFGIAIILIYLAYSLVCLKIATETRDYLNRGIVFGLTTTIFLQSCFQIAGSTTVFLLSGNTLPFISRGSTSLLICTLMSALVFRIHVFNQKRISEEKRANVIEETTQQNL